MLQLYLWFSHYITFIVFVQSKPFYKLKLVFFAFRYNLRWISIFTFACVLRTRFDVLLHFLQYVCRYRYSNHWVINEYFVRKRNYSLDQIDRRRKHTQKHRCGLYVFYAYIYTWKRDHSTANNILSMSVIIYQNHILFSRFHVSRKENTIKSFKMENINLRWLKMQNLLKCMLLLVLS